MKKGKKMNDLFILGISIAIIVIIGIIMKVNESFDTMPINTSTNKELKYYLNNFKPNLILKNVDVPDKMNVAVLQEDNVNYYGKTLDDNDISKETNISYANCFKKCLKDDSCKGIVTDFIPNEGNKGTCWMKNNVNKNYRKEINTNISTKKRYSTIIPK